MAKNLGALKSYYGSPTITSELGSNAERRIVHLASPLLSSNTGSSVINYKLKTHKIK